MAREVTARPERATEPRDTAATQPVALTDEQQAEVEEDIAAMRLWLTEQMPVMDHFFAVRILGSKWTRLHRGRSWDAVQAYSRVQASQNWAGEQFMQGSMRFSNTDLTREQGLALASCWCTRMSQLYHLYVDSDEDPGWWQPQDADALDDAELTAMQAEVEEGTAMWQRCQDIRACVPGQLLMRPGAA